MDYENVKLSYCLLLFYGLKARFNRLKQSKEYKSNPILRKIIDDGFELIESNGWPDVYDYFDNPDIIVEPANLLLESISSTKLIDAETFFILLTGYYDVEFETSNLKKISNEMANCFNEIVKEKHHFELIYDNYMDVKASIGDLELGTSDFNQALIGRDNQGRKPLTSIRSIEELNEHFEMRLKKESKINTFIEENLPLQILREIPTLTEKRIEQYYKRLLARKLYAIIKPLEISRFRKISVLGFSFLFFNYCDSHEQFALRYGKKHRILNTDDKAIHEYYREYLFDQVKNSLK